MTPPREIYVVIDESGLPGYSATYAGACHEHIRDSQDRWVDVPEMLAMMSRQVVRRYVLAPEHDDPPAGSTI